MAKETKKQTGSIYLIVSNKGGVGKTTVTTLLSQVAALRGLHFEYIELDNSNDSTTSLANSKIFENKMASCKTSKAQTELFNATFKATKENKTVFIDVGGGLDSIEVIEVILEEFAHLDIKFILPFENSYKQMQNLKDTYNFINLPEKTYLVKNKVINFKDEKDDYIFFEGSKELGIDSVRKEINPVNKVFEVALSDLNQIAELTKESILDLAQIAMQYSPAEASDVFMEEAKDINEYNQLMQRYSKSSKCLKEIEKLNLEFEELFNG